MFDSKHMLVVLACPPTTTGARTLARLENLKKDLRVETLTIVNLLNVPFYRTGGMSEGGKDENVWIASREFIGNGIKAADVVLLAYGVSEPTGTARRWHRDQVMWLHSQIGARKIPAFQVGDRARHPSRWHRLTTITHPQMDVSKAVLKLIQPATLSGV